MTDEELRAHDDMRLTIATQGDRIAELEARLEASGAALADLEARLAAYEPPPDDPRLREGNYFILSLIHSHGKERARWWGQERSGYVLGVDEAGVYSAEELASLGLGDGRDVAVPCLQAMYAVGPTVDMSMPAHVAMSMWGHWNRCP